MQLARRAIGLAIGLSVALGAAGHALAQAEDLRTADFSTWTLAGSASYVTQTFAGNRLDYLFLTSPGAADTRGAAFAPSGVLLDFNQPFTYSFRFFVAPGSVTQGDGLTFFIAGYDPLTALPAGGGSDLGYGGSPAGSYAFAVDTFYFPQQNPGDPFEPVAPSIQILRDGDTQNPLAYTETGLSDIRNPSYFQWNAHLEYTPSGNDDETGQLTGTIEQPVGNLWYSVSHGVDWSGVGEAQFVGDTYAGRIVHIGFTAANGLADDGHIISSAMPVPEPGTWLMLLAGLGVVGMRMAGRRAG